MTRPSNSLPLLMQGDCGLRKLGPELVWIQIMRVLKLSRRMVSRMLPHAYLARKEIYWLIYAATKLHNRYNGPESCVCFCHYFPPVIWQHYPTASHWLVKCFLHFVTLMLSLNTIYTHILDDAKNQEPHEIWPSGIHIESHRMEIKYRNLDDRTKH